MRKFLISIVLLAAPTLQPAPAEGQPGPKKRIAVLDFDSAAVQGGMTSVFFQTTAPNTGKAAADLVVTRLVQAGEVSVIERAALDKLLAEQNLSNSDRTDALTAARIGRVLGVDGIVLGTITKWDYDDKVTGGGGSRLGGMIGRSSMTMKHDIKARVEVSARLVSPETAEVLAVAQGVGEIIRKGVKVDMRDTGQMGVMGAGGGSNPTMSEAMDQAVVQLAAELGKNFPKLPRYIPAIDGLVADADESGRLVLNVGGRSGVKPGDRLQIWRAGKEIRDPATGKLLMRDDALLGEAVVKTVTDNASIAAYSGAEKIKTGDLVKSPPHPAGGPQ
jgi:curli biogenesis system outer membrane secretion channel CsgG